MKSIQWGSINTITTTITTANTRVVTQSSINCYFSSSKRSLSNPKNSCVTTKKILYENWTNFTIYWAFSSSWVGSCYLQTHIFSAFKLFWLKCLFRHASVICSLAKNTYSTFFKIIAWNLYSGFVSYAESDDVIFIKIL